MTREELKKMNAGQLISLLLELRAESARLKEQQWENSNKHKDTPKDGNAKPSPKSLRKKNGEKGIKATR